MRTVQKEAMVGRLGDGLPGLDGCGHSKASSPPRLRWQSYPVTTY